MTLEELRERNFVNVAETAAFFGLDDRTVRRAIQTGQIPAQKIGTQMRIPVPALLAMLAVPDAPAPAPSSPILNEDAIRVAVETMRASLDALEGLLSITARIRGQSGGTRGHQYPGQGLVSVEPMGDQGSPLIPKGGTGAT
ncbi:MAG: Helix-turn-helix domain [Streptosporangiaceae bacterium]|nr:Helix-turn-helix domain [Streptosporangiaceae bacterium]